MTKASRRYIRTIILGVLAMAALVWVAMVQFEIDRQEMLSLFLAVVIGAAGIITAAGLALLLWLGLRKLWGRK